MSRPVRQARPVALVPVMIGSFARAWDTSWDDDPRPSARRFMVLSALVSAAAMEELADTRAMPLLEALDAAWDAVEAWFTKWLADWGYTSQRIGIINAVAGSDFMLTVQEIERRNAYKSRGTSAT